MGSEEWEIKVESWNKQAKNKHMNSLLEQVKLEKQGSDWKGLAGPCEIWGYALHLSESSEEIFQNIDVWVLLLITLTQ